MLIELLTVEPEGSSLKISEKLETTAKRYITGGTSPLEQERNLLLPLDRKVETYLSEELSKDRSLKEGEGRCNSDHSMIKGITSNE